jgi:tripartite-type tricarboxylate transporter receptor subunit TctC
MNVLIAAVVVASPMILAIDAVAQTNYPEHQIRLVAGFPPGAQSDTVARLLGQKLAEAWGKPVVIDNITGAAGNIAADRIVKAAPDGYTMGLLGQAQMVVNPSLYKLTYNTVKDFAPVSQVYTSTNVLIVHNTVPAKSVKELVALAKAQPGALTFASGGSGSSNHMAAELLKSVAGLDIRHIPYKGVVLAIPDVLAGRVMMMFSPTSNVMPLVWNGKLRALAVTSLKRSAVVPELPTIAESGYPGFEATIWMGVFAPAKTPVTILRKLHLEIVKALALADLRAKFGELGIEPVGNSPDEFATVIASGIPKWAKVIKQSGIKPD